MTGDLRDDLHARRALVDAYLPRALDLAAGCPARLREAMAYSLLAPGKRLRPLLVLLAAEAAGVAGRPATSSLARRWPSSPATPC